MIPIQQMGNSGNQRARFRCQSLSSTLIPTVTPREGRPPILGQRGYYTAPQSQGALSYGVDPNTFDRWRYYLWKRHHFQPFASEHDADSTNEHLPCGTVSRGAGGLVEYAAWSTLTMSSSMHHYSPHSLNHAVFCALKTVDFWCRTRSTKDQCLLLRINNF